MGKSTEKPNILLLIFDTLRADYLYSEDTETPTIDQIARNGTIFEEAYSAAPGTSVSHPVMFSGQYPSETGVVGQTDVPDDIPLVASWLRDAGYDTFGIPGPGRMGSEWGFDRGFTEYFEAYTDDHPGYTSFEFINRIATDSSLRGPLVRDFVREVIRGPDSLTSFKFDLLSEKIENELEEPFFGMLNTTVVHSPYNPPRPFKENSTPELDRPRLHILEYLLNTTEKLDMETVRSERVYNAQKGDGIARYTADPSYLREAELEVLRTWYRASIEYLDTQLRSFLSQLEQAGQLDNTILILTADHGEHFGEHDLLTHGDRLYKESLQVPLIIDGPNVPATRRDDLVSLVDVFDTVCDLASIPAPEETSGRSVFGDGSREFVCAEYGKRPEGRGATVKYLTGQRLEEFCAGRKSIRTKEHMYEYTSNEEETLYSLPDEMKIENPNREIVQYMQEKLFQTVGEEFKSVSEERELSDGLKSNLRELGYKM